MSTEIISNVDAGRPATRLVAAAEQPVPWIAGLWQHRNVLLILLDALAVGGAFMVAYYIRFYAQFLAIKQVPVAAVGSYLKGAAVLTILWLFFIWRDGGYECGIQGAGPSILRIRSVALSGLYALAVLMAVSYLYRGLLLSRQVYLMTGVLAGGTMILVRLLVQAMDRDLGAQGVAAQDVVVAGLDDHAIEFADRLRQAGGTIRVVGLLRLDGPDEKPNRPVDVPVLGDLADVPALHARRPFGALVLSSPDRAHAAGSMHPAPIMPVLNFCEANGIVLYMLSGAFDVAVTRREVGSVSGAPLIRLRDAAQHQAYAVVKRLTDVCLAAAGVVGGLPIWLLIALAVKLTSRGPVFFTQTRVGLHGRPFRMYKFRTMIADAHERLDGVVDVDRLEVPGFKIRNDPRVTSLGRFLRVSGLDEIPQLINVLRGEMSLVGPRPEMPELVARYTPEQRRRLKAKPGITGYQQVMARGIPLAAGVKYDLIYLKYQSVLLDAYILLRTLLVIVRGSGVAY